MLVPSFTVACTPSFFSVVQGESVAVSCAITSQNGFSAPVNLSCANVPPGAACGFSSTPVTPPPSGTVNSTLTLEHVRGDARGIPHIQADGTSGTLTRSVSLSVNVLLRDFTLGCVPGSLSVVQGSSVTSTCRVTSLNMFSAPVTLSCGPMPAGATCTFDPAEVTPPADGFVFTTLTVTTSSATPVATAAFQVRGTGGGLTRSTPTCR